ncbi:hypothetical protein QJS04_geneDACA014125 [Acorus gramineus]|uniref:Uncharacterized protein n=1 Tax=Acorus gramineus TaxID=55184 RepID=A0AAV9B7V8_ACOGR|nr:hypothetical protein QJS04_geneDACA014125 [Acorus gramineus]
MGHAKSTNRNHRLNLPRWGALILAVARKAYGRVEETSGPIGSLARAISFVAGPICYLIQCQWLAILALIDDQIATIENAIESTFPFTAHIFNKIDWLLAAPKREEELIVVDITCDEKPMESKLGLS